MLYHSSDDSGDLYKQKNSSPDLLGKVYYDEYDDDYQVLVESVTSLSYDHAGHIAIASCSTAYYSGRIAQNTFGSSSGYAV